MLHALRAIWAWIDERTGIGAIMKHPVPREHGWRGWMYVFGTATLTSFLVAVITGIPIATAYIPSTGDAYQSIKWLDDVAVLGKQLRGLHNISATAMLVLVGVHAIRVFLTGAFKYPRELNWLSGVVLLFLTVGLLFTGQILRWDDAGVWTLSITSFASSRFPLWGDPIAHFAFGGPTISGITLSRYFALHVFVLPGLLLAIVGFHLYMVLKVGISESPRSGRPVNPRTYRAWYQSLLKREGVPFWPDAAWRDVVFGTFVVLVIVGLAIAIGPPPLGGPPDPTHVQVQPRPDWYFIWFYAALAMTPKGAEDYTMILGPVLFALLLFSIPFIANRGERSPLRRPWAVISVLLAVLMMTSFTLFGELAPWSPRFQATSLPKQAAAGLTSGAASRGARLFTTAGCQYCHTVYGTSGGIAGPSLTNIGNELTADQLTIRILIGGTNMPAFGRNLSPDQVRDLVAFLQTRREYKAAPLHPAVPGPTPANAGQ
jgi:ubiquinol-cytochrome c reductase cytochrome b subunit